MSALNLVLERFDSHEDRSSASGLNGEDIIVQRARAEAYSEGFAAGQAAAMATADEQVKFLSEVCSVLETELAEIPIRLSRQSGKAFSVVLRKILPVLAESKFAIEAAEAFNNIQITSSINSIEITVPPEKVEPLKAAIANLNTTGNLNVTSDPTLTGAVANATWQGGGMEFDLDQAIADCLTALENAYEAAEIRAAT